MAPLTYHRSFQRPPGAMSTILPSVDALLGIRNTSANLREVHGWGNKKAQQPSMVDNCPFFFRFHINFQ